MTNMIKRDISGVVQTASGGNATVTILSDWVRVNNKNKIAVINLHISAHGVTSKNSNAYHRHEVFELGYNRIVARYVGTMLSRPEEIEQTSAANAVISLSGNNNIVITFTGPTGAGAEIVNWSWRGDIKFAEIDWDNPYNIIKDYSGSGFNGTMTNMESGDISADSPGAGSTYSTAFGGTDEYATMGDVLGFERTSAFSASYWFKQGPSAPSQYILSKMLEVPGVSITGYGIFTNTDGYQLVQLISTNVPDCLYVRASVPVGVGVWHHVVWTFSGSSTAAGFHCYIDGTVQVLTVYYDALVSSILNANAFQLGCRSNGSGCLVASLNNVAVYNKELSQAEVTEIYAGGTCPDLKSLSMAANVVGWWRMGD
jgi:hypothetical protein